MYIPETFYECLRALNSKIGNEKYNTLNYLGDLEDLIHAFNIDDLEVVDADVDSDKNLVIRFKPYREEKKND